MRKEVRSPRGFKSRLSAVVLLSAPYFIISIVCITALVSTLSQSCLYADTPAVLLNEGNLSSHSDSKSSISGQIANQSDKQPTKQDQSNRLRANQPVSTDNVVVYSRPSLKPDNAFPHFCDRTERKRHSTSNYDLISHNVTSQQMWPEVECFWAEVKSHALPTMGQYDICTHDPEVDTVISTALHVGNFWGGTGDFAAILAVGPCSAERPYFLDIGANLGFVAYILLSTECRGIAFEPLYANAKRMLESSKRNGYSDRLYVYKHAVGSYHDTVRLNFVPNNPGASSISGGDESMEMITIDSLLLGPNPPVFKPSAEERARGITELLPVIGKHIGYIKIDTEGFDVPVIMGAIQTIIEGKVPMITIEFQPRYSTLLNCDPYDFVDVMYDNGYRMVDLGHVYERDELLAEFPALINSLSFTAYESFFATEDVLKKLHRRGFISTGMPSHLTT